MRGKRGDGDLITEYIVFIIFSLLFFVVAIAFASKMGDSALVYEQMYSKKIALGIDAAKPGMTIYLNTSDLFKFSKNPGILIGPDDKGVNIVKVTLSDKGKGYSYSFFSSYMINYKINSLQELVIEVKNAK